MSMLPFDAGLVLGVALLLAFAIALLWARSRQSRAAVLTQSDSFGATIELRDLPHRSGDHTTPDAIVRLPENFDPDKPIHVVIYNHGFYTDVRGSFRETRMYEQFRKAPSNSLLFMPEWQKTPRARSSDQGQLTGEGMYDRMLQDAFDRIPGLKGLAVEDVLTVSILGHSAGYNPTETQLYRNLIGSKCVSVTLLDALYDQSGFDTWLDDNLKMLAATTKRFVNVFYGTQGYSKEQASRIKHDLKENGLATSCMLEDYDRGNEVLTADQLAANSIVFKYSSLSLEALSPHFAIPNLYIGLCIGADTALVEKCRRDKKR